MKICVIGTGTMGRGIVQSFIQKGYAILLKGRSEESISKAVKSIEKNLQRLVEKEKITADQMKEMLSKITTTLKYEDAADMDMVIEAISEDMAVKKEIFALLDKICRPETILCTNTSSLSITEVAAVTSRPDKVIGMHFFNPVPLMKLVEVIKGQLTSEEIHAKVVELVAAIGKTAVTVYKYTVPYQFANKFPAGL